MTKEEHIHFNRLKEDVAKTFLSSHSASHQIEDWKGETISLFQEDLFFKTKAKVSEKWFYTYFKNDVKKLPRIDMLNILCEYVNNSNWEDYKASNSKIEKQKTSQILIYVFGFAGMLLIGYFINIALSKNTFEFCFIDEDKGQAITQLPLDIKILLNDESPMYFKTDSLGCFKYETKSDQITFVVQSPFHQTDTVTRHIQYNTNNLVKLSTDDYALMLDYYTNGKIQNIKKRRKELDELFDDDAVIYQLYKNNLGIELYSKQDFISRLTTPTTELKRIKILDKTYHNNRITKLKFIVE